MSNPIAIQWQSFMEGYKSLMESGDRKHHNPLLFVDYLLCAVRYGSSASDYFDFEFYNKRHHARKTFWCYRLKKKLFHALNDYSKKPIFDDKATFLRTFDKFIGREWLDMAECDFDAFSAFCDRHGRFIAKPRASSGGKGIRVMRAEGDLQELYKTLRDENAVVEELLVQHPQLSELYPGSLNTMRVVTVMVRGEVRILAAALRCGSGGAEIDNVGSGGYAVKIDPDSGTLISDGRGHGNKRAIRHPDTGVMFHGFRIPHWDKVKAMLNEAARVVPGVGYTGWDVAVREDDAVIVEGNFEGMIHLIQRPADQGIKAEVEAIMKEIRQEKNA